MKLAKNFFAAMLISFSFNGVVHALETAQGYVTSIEATYLPGTIKFKLDGGTATCPAGTTLTWQKPDAENNKAIYATLVTALVSNKKIKFYNNNGDATCKANYLYIKDN